VEKVTFDESSPRKQRQRQWEKLDAQLTDLRLKAEHKCRKIKSGRLQWSPELSLLRIQKKFWVLAYKRKTKQKRKVDSKFFQRIAKAAQLDPFTLPSPDHIQTEIHKINTKLKQYSINHQDRRTTWLEGLALALAINDGDTNDHQQEIKKLQFLRQLQQREEQRLSARVIRNAVSCSDSYQQLDHVIFKDKNGELVETAVKEEMEFALLQENQRRFNQAARSPFMRPPLLEVVGKYGEAPGVKDLLQAKGHLGGSATENHLDMTLKSMVAPEGISPVVIDESEETFAKGWEKSREHTASGMSGLHFGHFIAACRHPALRTIECAMANFPMKMGYSPKRWQQGIEVMLLKQKNNFNVEKLRAILLFEADFNYNNKRIGRAMMWNAENHKLMAQEQYGSRKGLSAIDHCLNKRLSFDVLRQNKQAGAICINDMKGCYDRIVHAVAAICMKRLGMQNEPLRMMFYTLQQLRHFVRTAYGCSESFFDAQQVNSVAIQGIGQGNGAGPQIWAAISSAVLDMMRKQQCGGEFCAPVSGENLHLVGYAYVDDTDIITTVNHNDNKLLEEKIQRAIHLWEGSLTAIGGQLEPQKTYWYRINFKWNNGKWKYMAMKDSTAQISMTNEQGEVVPVEQLEVTEARRTLGVRLAPDGNNQEEFKYLKETCDAWADRIRSGMVRRKYAWQAFSSTIWAKVSYALPATTFTKNQCEAITKKMIGATLSASGINKHLPRDLVFGSKTRQGLEYPDMYVWQGAEGLARMIRFMQTDDHLSGKLMRTSYELLQLESGSHHPMSLPYAKWNKSITDSFIKHLWQFIDHFGIQIRSPSVLGKGFREEDRTITETLPDQLSGVELDCFNRCRIFMRVVWWSEITTGDGSKVSWAALNGKRDCIPKNSWKWPYQGDPTEYDWGIWRKVLNDLTRKDRNGNHWLYRPLGRWYSDEQAQWFYEENTDRMFNTITEVVYTRKIGKATRQASKKYIESAAKHENFPRGAIATVKQYGKVCELEGWSTIEHKGDVTQTKCNFKAFIQQNYKWKWWSENWEGDENMVIQVASDIANGNGFAACDGSYKEGKGTASTVVQGKSTGPKVYTSVMVPGDTADQNAYRSELAGILATIQMVNAICQYQGVKQGSMTLCCDGKSALNQSFNKNIHVDLPQYDILVQSKLEIKKSPVKWTYKHVMGHQSIFPLDRAGTLNDEMDIKCKGFWVQTQDTQRIWFHNEWQLVVNNKPISSNLSKSIREYCAIKRAENYWNAKQQGLHKEVDWEAIASANNGIQRSRLQWITKHVSGFCAVGKMAKKMGLRVTDECPHCKSPESTQHVWQCQTPQTDAIWKTGLKELKVELGRLQTKVATMDQIEKGLNSWRNLCQPDCENEQGAILLQTELGWGHFFEGRHHVQWRKDQEAVYTESNSKLTGKKWSSAIIRKIWEIAWKLWEHRNNTLYNKECVLQCEIINEKVVKLWNNKEMRRIKSLKKIIPNDLSTLLDTTLSKKQQWAARVEAAIQRDEERNQASHLENERRAMRKFLSRWHSWW
jgi:hypothetical protein